MMRLTAVCLLFTICFLFTGCNEAGDFFSGQTQEKPVITSTDISVAIRTYETLNPVITKNEDIFYMEKLIYDSLVRLDGQYAAQPHLAESWEYDDNKTSITFHLKEGVTWHDGKKFTADDVKFTIDTLMRANTSNSLISQYTSKVKSVRKNGDRAVTVQFYKAEDSAVENFIFPIIPEHQFRSVNDVFWKKDNFKPIGTGVYQVSEITDKRLVKLVANDTYHGGQIPQNTMTFKCVPDENSAVELMRINDVNAFISKDTERAVLLAGRDIYLDNYPSGEAEIIGFNTENSFLSDERVRKGISYGIDTEQIIETAYMGNGMPVKNIFPIGYLGENPSEPLSSLDTAAASAAFESAGYYDLNRDLILDDMDGNNIILKIIVNSDNEARLQAAEIIKKGLESVKIDSEIVPLEWENYRNAINSGNYDLFIGGFTLSDMIDFDFLLNSTVNNPAKYENPALDEYLTQLKSENNSQSKKETFKAVKNVLERNIPYYPLLYKTNAMVMTTTMQGNLDILWFDPYRNCTNWQYTYEIE